MVLVTPAFLDKTHPNVCCDKGKLEGLKTLCLDTAYSTELVYVTHKGNVTIVSKGY